MANFELTGPTNDLAGFREAIGLGERNAANGFAGLDADGHLVGTIQNRTGTDAEINAITLAIGEFAYTTDTQEIRVGDGITAGGIFLHAKPQITGGRLGPLTTSDTPYGTITAKAGCLYRVRAVIRIATAGMRCGVTTPTGQAVVGSIPFSLSFGGFRNITNNTLTSAVTGIGSAGGITPTTIANAGDYYIEGVSRSNSTGAAVIASHPSSTGSVFDLFYLEVQRIA